MVVCFATKLQTLQRSAGKRVLQWCWMCVLFLLPSLASSSPLTQGQQQWQTFRSTSRVTCAARFGDNLWSGTEKSGFIRWDLLSGSYQFVVPRVKSPLARKILALAIDPRGRLWFGTNGYGVGYYNAFRRQWRFVRTQNGIPHNVVQAVHITSSGVWIGTRRGAAFLKNGQSRWKVYTRKQGFPGLDIRGIRSDRQGRVWFSAADSFPFYLHNGRLQTLSRFPAVGTSCMVPGKGNALWFCSAQGLVLLQGRRTTLYTIDYGLPSNDVRALSVDARGGVWIGTKGKGVTYFRRGRWKYQRGLRGRDIRAFVKGRGKKLYSISFLNGVEIYAKRRWRSLGVGIAGNTIRVIRVAPDDSIWIGTTSGVSRYKAGRWTNFADGLPALDIRAFAFDPAGAVWIGTYGGGVARYFNKRFRKYELLDGLGSNKIIGGGVSPDGIWMAHIKKGLSLYSKGRWRTIQKRQSNGLLTKRRPLQVFLLDNQLQPRVATYGQGVMRRKRSGRWRRMRAMRNPTLGLVKAMAQDSKGRFWFGTNKGLYRVSGRRVKKFTTRQGLPSNRILSVATEGDIVWFGTPTGVGCIRGRRVRVFRQGYDLLSDHVTAIAVSPWGEKWFGTAGDGVTLFRGRCPN